MDRSVARFSRWILASVTSCGNLRSASAISFRTGNCDGDRRRWILRRLLLGREGRLRGVRIYAVHFRRALDTTW